jgi:hypothetical protein
MLARSTTSRANILHTGPTKWSSDIVAHLEQLDQLYDPKPGLRCWSMTMSKPANSPWQHLPRGRTGLLPERFPRYAPELNDIEVVWHDHLAHQSFADTDALDRAIH